MMEEESTAMRHDSPVEQAAPEPSSTPAQHHDLITVDESMLDDADLLGSTPRPAGGRVARANMSDIESPYETMRREMKNEEEEGHTTVLEDEDSSIMFAQRTARLPDMTMTPQALIEKRNREQEAHDGQAGKDPLLHRVLDKNYRLQATPHKSTSRGTPKHDKSPAKPSWADSPGSSPEMAVPKMRSEAFMSPYKSMARQRFEAASHGPRTPGVSVQTPGMGKKAALDEITWESDDDDLMAGRSPPKTIQFALPPSKLLQTPGMSMIAVRVDDVANERW